MNIEAPFGIEDPVASSGDRGRRRSTIPHLVRTLVVVLATLTACSTQTAAPSPATPAPDTPSSVALTSAAPSPDVTTSAPATAAPSAGPSDTTAPEPAAIAIGPEAALVGAELGTATDDALTALTVAFGDPSEDTGWNEGCPLDGAGDNERAVSWGGLEAQFRRDGDDPGELFAWGYATYRDAAGGPPAGSVVLPGNTRLGAPIGAIADASGFTTEYNDVFDMTSLGDGFEVFADGDDLDAPATGAYVPFLPTCD